VTAGTSSPSRAMTIARSHATGLVARCAHRNPSRRNRPAPLVRGRLARTATTVSCASPMAARFRSAHHRRRNAAGRAALLLSQNGRDAVDRSGARRRSAGDEAHARGDTGGVPSPQTPWHAARACAAFAGRSISARRVREERGAGV
jgi:hypothetical protein